MESDTIPFVEEGTSLGESVRRPEIEGSAAAFILNSTVQGRREDIELDAEQTN